jgi:transketolase
MTLHRQAAPRVTDVSELAAIAKQLRRDLIRMIAPRGQGYVQQGLGAADLFSTLFFSELRLSLEDPYWVDRDRFILSTAHNTAVFYATLAARGLIPKSLLDQYCRDGAAVEINASERLGPVVEATCGSLGQGLSVGVGIAQHAKRCSKEFRTYVLLGDGEMQEGQVWEAAMYASAYGLSGLCLIIDLNQMQVEGQMSGALTPLSIRDKWSSFGWNTSEVNGHDFSQLMSALTAARVHGERPSCIIAHTIIGKGVPSLEGKFGHNIRLSNEQAQIALGELQ